MYVHEFSCVSSDLPCVRFDTTTDFFQNSCKELRNSRNQCRFKLISGMGRKRSMGPLGTGGSKFITRKYVKFSLSGTWVLASSAQWINQH
ncbi:hypothetical protein TNCV_3844121 [Trichonephila clavipes]|nr:hypothetical protein TNCV_3844121 [Trichonephila clavipes]